MSKESLTYVQLNHKRCSDLLLKDCVADSYQRIPAPLLLEEGSRLLAESFRELFASVSIDRKRGIWTNELTMTERGNRIEGDYDFVVPTEFALSFFKTYKVLSEATRKLHENGTEIGKNLLFGLNNGTLTMNEFNDNIQK